MPVPEPEVAVLPGFTNEECEFLAAAGGSRLDAMLGRVGQGPGGEEPPGDSPEEPDAEDLPGDHGEEPEAEDLPGDYEESDTEELPGDHGEEPE